MRPDYYEARWQGLKSNPDPVKLESLAQRVAATFLDRYFYSDEYNSRYPHILCDMATHFEEPDLGQIASSALFGIVIERLCDDFEELQTETYNRLICQVVEFLRRHPKGKALDDALNGFSLGSEAQLYERIEAMRLNPDVRVPEDVAPRKVIILSRVTIGADVAVTSVICQRIAATFPGAKILIAGSSKLKEVFPATGSIGILELHYARRGGLLERFLAWVDLLRAVQEEISGLQRAEFLVLDPDSRLTQLGVLPLVPDECYRFFNSRGKADYPVRASITMLTNLWLDQILGTEGFIYPRVWTQALLVDTAARIRKSMLPGRQAGLIVLNFGVGGNVRKLVPGSFETDLVLALVSIPDLCVVLDMGLGVEERLRSEKILAAVANAGYPVESGNFQSAGRLRPDLKLLGLECSIAEISALLACSNEFIGYDSACQHIAAALGIRTYTIFAGTSNVRFIRRWRASGPNRSEIIYVDTVSRHQEIDPQEVIERLMDLRQDD